MPSFHTSIGVSARCDEPFGEGDGRVVIYGAAQLLSGDKPIDEAVRKV